MTAEHSIERQIRGPARGYWQFENGGGVRQQAAYLADLKQQRWAIKCDLAEGRRYGVAV